MRKGHLSNICDVHMEDVLPRGSLDLHRRTAPAPLDAPVGTLQHQLPGVEELELLWVRTEVAQDRAQLGPRRVTDTKVLAILRLYRDRRLVAQDPRFPRGGFGLLRSSLPLPFPLVLV